MEKIFFDLDQTTVDSSFSVGLCNAGALLGREWLDVWREIRCDPFVVKEDQALPLMAVLQKMFKLSPDLVAVCTARQLNGLELDRLYEIGLPEKIKIYDRGWATIERVGGINWCAGGSDSIMKPAIAKHLGVKNALLIDDMEHNISAFHDHGFGGILAADFEKTARILATKTKLENQSNIDQAIWTAGQFLEYISAAM